VDWAAIGKTADQAARFCDAWIIRRTLSQVEDLVQGEGIGALEVKGFGHPLAACNFPRIEARFAPQPGSG
jgi:hypothetical protein